MKLTDKLLGIIAKALLIIALNTSTSIKTTDAVEHLTDTLDKVLTKQL